MLKYVYSGISLQNGRSSNMDSLLLKVRDVGRQKALLAVVCDGVGSCREGAFASGVAAKMLGEWFDAISEFEYAGLKMRDAVSNINTYIVEKVKQNRIRTASTLSAMLLVEERYYIVHTGDSRVYVFDGDKLLLLTNDDISETGKLTSYIGQEKGMIPQYLEGYADRHTFLVCSDGLYKRMDNQYLIRNIKADSGRLANHSVHSLVQYVMRQGEKDNITIALIKAMS